MQRAVVITATCMHCAKPHAADCQNMAGRCRTPWPLVTFPPPWAHDQQHCTSLACKSHHACACCDAHHAHHHHMQHALHHHGHPHGVVASVMPMHACCKIMGLAPVIIALIIAAACITTWALHALFPALCMPCTMVPHGWPCGDATVFSFTIAHPSNNTP